MKKKILILVLVLLFTSFPVEVMANSASVTNENEISYYSADEFYSAVKDNLVAHNMTFTLNTSTDIMDEVGTDLTDILDEVYAMDDTTTSRDADYLRVTIGSWKLSWTRYDQGPAIYRIDIDYKTTLKQEQKLDSKLVSVLAGLKLDGKSDYDKAKAIHNYIVNRVSYDQNRNKHSAYDALINRSSVCEGYAALTYRMFTDAGLECKIISGWGNGDTHAWNIVEVGSAWYNIDTTWDDPTTKNGEKVLRYDYFLKDEKTFSDHIRDAEFTTDEFFEAYPIAKNSYKK